MIAAPAVIGTISAMGSAPTGAAEVTQIVCLADSGGILADTMFLMHDASGAVGVYFSEDGDPSPPPASSTADRHIEVTFTENMTAAEIAEAVAGALNADGGFTAEVDEDDDDTVIVTDALMGARTDAVDGDGLGSETTGFGISILTQGVDP